MQNLANSIVVGRTASGKTTFAINNILNDPRIAKVLVMAYGIQYKSQYSAFATYDLGRERKCVEAIKKLITFHKRMAKMCVDKKIRKLPISMLCLDDFIGSDISLRSGELCKLVELLFTQGRHIGIYCCLITQSFKQIKPVIRNNSGYIVLMGRLNITTFAEVAEYQSEYMSPGAFFMVYCEYLKQKNYGAIIINTTNEGDEIEFK